jgi:hypothetical protein
MDEINSTICMDSHVKLFSKWGGEANLYAGTFVHPLELVFCKPLPWIDDIMLRFTRLSLSNLNWTVPLCALCSCGV